MVAIPKPNKPLGDPKLPYHLHKQALTKQASNQLSFAVKKPVRSSTRRGQEPQHFLYERSSCLHLVDSCGDLYQDTHL